MADLQEQLQAILADPQAMGQITAIARALTGGNAPTAEQAPPPGPDFVPVDEPAQESGKTGEPGPSAPPQPGGAPPAGGQMPDLSALTSLLGGMGDVDPRLIRTALAVYSEYSAQDNEKAALLAALKPFLRGERLEKMEKAEKAARLARLVRVALRLLKEGGEGHV